MVSGRDGAARKFNLDFYCKSFGIESPKSHGVTGALRLHMLQTITGFFDRNLREAPGTGN